MTLPTTARHGLPLLSAGQAQKEVAHNEALLIADFLMNPVAEELGREMPPLYPEPGQAWILGSAPLGEWTGRAGQIACWTAGGWRYFSPFEGLHVWLRGADVWAVRESSGWSNGIVRATAVHVGGERVVSGRQPAIADPSGGTIVDEQARAAVAALLGALRAHGLISA